MFVKALHSVFAEDKTTTSYFLKKLFNQGILVTMFLKALYTVFVEDKTTTFYFLKKPLNDIEAKI